MVLNLGAIIQVNQGPVWAKSDSRWVASNRWPLNTGMGSHNTACNFGGINQVVAEDRNLNWQVSMYVPHPHNYCMKSQEVYA